MIFCQRQNHVWIFIFLYFFGKRKLVSERSPEEWASKILNSVDLFYKGGHNSRFHYTAYLYTYIISMQPVG